ncbi:MAG: hypothetical protein K6A42_05180 [Treponema sp.]|nr:hypothetical protein [Treponema sp.]
MKESDFFESGRDFSSLKIYSIVKRERLPKSLLARPSNFSWPPKKECGRIFDVAAKGKDKK